MICFLTSSTVIPGTETLNPANRFIDMLREYLPKPCRTLFICSDPDHSEGTDRFADSVKQSFKEAGFPFQLLVVLDSRNENSAAELVKEADLIILAGGHVPTQNRFFRRIGLRNLLREYDGIVIGISAGSMNSADVVYAQPEEKGEAADPGYEKFLPGLGLTKTMILPHYQMVKDDILDGQRLFEDITLPDSIGRTFYAIPDGSYLLIESGTETLRGEAYEIRDGRLRRIAESGDVLTLGNTRIGSDM